MADLDAPAAAAGTILVTGATGTIGRRLVARLRERGADVREGGRDPRRIDAELGAPVLFDWTDPRTFAPAVAGVECLYLLRPSGLGADSVGRIEQFLAVARQAGVRRAVLLHSMVAGPMGTPEIPAAVRRIMPEWAILCPSWFMQNFTGDHPTARGIRERGEIATATGAGRIAFIDADDIAEVAAAALLDSEPPNRDYVLTGPEPLSYPDIAALLTDISGRPVHYVELTPDQLTARWLAAGLPESMARTATDLDLAIRDDEYARTTTTVEDVTGHPPRSFGQFARSHLAG